MMDKFKAALVGAFALALFMTVVPSAQKAAARQRGGKVFSFAYQASTAATRVVEDGVETYYDELRCSPQAAGSALFGSKTRLTYPVGDCTYCDAKLTIPARSIYAKTTSGTLDFDCIGIIW